MKYTFKCHSTERNVIYMAESSSIRQAILELTNGWTDYKTINKLLKQYDRPSYIKAGLYVLLWWKGTTWDNEYCEFPTPQFFHDHWAAACKKAGVRDSKEEMMIKELIIHFGDTYAAMDSWTMCKDMSPKDIISKSGANIDILGKMPRDTDKVYYWYCSNIDCIFVSLSYSRIEKTAEYYQCWCPQILWTTFKPVIIYDCLTWRDKEEE